MIRIIMSPCNNGGLQAYAQTRLPTDVHALLQGQSGKAPLPTGSFASVCSSSKQAADTANISTAVLVLRWRAQAVSLLG